MKHVQIKNVASQQYTHGAKFDSQVEAQAWIDSQLSAGLKCAWGKPEHTIQVEVSPYVPAVFEEQQVLVAEAILDEEGNELEAAEYELQNVMISPAVEAVYEDQIVPSEFEIEILDITAQVAQEQVNRESQAFLDSSDWKILRHLREQTLGLISSLTPEQFSALELARSEAANAIVR